MGIKYMYEGMTRYEGMIQYGYEGMVQYGYQYTKVWV